MKKILLAVVLALAAPFAASQPYPSKQVRVIVPYPPGGGNDTLGRLFVVEKYGRVIKAAGIKLD